MAWRQNLTIQWSIIVRVDDLDHHNHHCRSTEKATPYPHSPVTGSSEQDLAKRQDTKANSPENNRKSLAVVVVAAAPYGYCWSNRWFAEVEPNGPEAMRSTEEVHGE